MNKRKIFTFLFLIVVLAGILRFYQLGKNPPSLDWDEASLGYNAYSILKTGRDEYGRFLPLSFRSFDDYKPPLYVYLTVPSVAFFGLNEFSVRFPSAFAGVVAVLLTYFLVKELFLYSSPRRSHDFPLNQVQGSACHLRVGKVALLSAFLLAISSWHLQFSRAAFEANVALTLIIAGAVFWFKGLKRSCFLPFSILFFILSLYTYHSPRIMVPLLVLGFAYYHRKKLLSVKKEVVLSGLIAVLLLLPLVFSFTKEGGRRLSSVAVITPSDKLAISIKKMEEDRQRGDYLGVLLYNRRIFYLKEVIGGYLDHFNFDFLFLKGDSPGRHHAADFGMLYPLDLPFILVGIFYLFQSKQSRPLFWWFLVAPVASSLTTGTPHAVRALLYLPIYQIFTAFGMASLAQCFLRKKINVYLLIFTFYLLLFTFYLHMYYVHTPYEYSQWWQYGYKQAINKAIELDKKNNYQKIIFTYKYDQPYIYYLFYGKIDPAWYQKNWDQEFGRFKRVVGKYEFRNINWDEDKRLKNTLIVGSSEEIPAEAEGLLEEINFLDGEIAFRIVEK